MGIIYIWFVGIAFIIIWARHVYLVHYKLNKYMTQNHGNIWETMKHDTGWYRPNWATLYYSKAVYDFIWKSSETYGDDYLTVLKKEIKRFIWELPLYFVAVILITYLLILMGILK